MAVRVPIVRSANGRLEQLQNGDTLGASSTPNVIVLADAATITTNARLGNRFRVSSSVDRTLGAPTNPTDGQFCTWEWKNAGGADRTLTLQGGVGGFRYGSGITGTTPTVAGKRDYIGAQYNGVDNCWDVLSYSKGF